LDSADWLSPFCFENSLLYKQREQGTERQVNVMNNSRYRTGNAIVDENAKLNISGNVIPQIWYRTIVRDSGKPNLTAIIILADIVYWYKPTELRDENTGQVVAVKKKFKADLLQRSYQQLSEQFGISKKEATNAIIFLEKLGVVKRIFRTVNINGLVVNNVLYLELNVEILKWLTYPQDYSNFQTLESEGKEVVAEGAELPENAEGQAGTNKKKAISFQRERVSPFKEIPAAFSQRDISISENRVSSSGKETNTETTQKITTETIRGNTTKINTEDDIHPIQSYQTVKEQFKTQIDYEAIWTDRPYDRTLLNEIVSIAVDILTSTAKTIRINREDKPTEVVQEIYKKIGKNAIDFVIDSINNCGSKAINIRAVLITALYNAAMTTASYITNLYAYHSAN
jgi:DNA-binding Lrp family transcriptional regulator